MNLYIRLILVLIKSMWASRIDILSASTLTFRVLPTDLDSNMHMNNGRYLTIMDLGRINLIIRNGFLRTIIKNTYAPVLGAAQMRFRIQLRPFQKYDLETRIICWDKKWAYIEQKFIIADGPKLGAVAAIGILKGSFYDPKTKTTVPTDTIIQTLPKSVQKNSPEFPDYVLKWIEAENALREVTSAKNDA